MPLVIVDGSEVLTLHTYILIMACLIVKTHSLSGILSSHGKMTLERLHSMLRLISDGSNNEAKFDMTVVQLRRFLLTLIDAKKLELLDDTYSIRK